MTRTPLVLPQPRRRLKRFDTERGARQWARAFDVARAANALPLLSVEPDETGAGWWAVNPDARAVAQPGRKPEKS